MSTSRIHRPGWIGRHAERLSCLVRATESVPEGHGVRIPCRTTDRDAIPLTSCSRQADTSRHRATPADTERHVERDLVRSRSNLRIQCPKGRGSSSLPSRTAVTSSYAIEPARAGGIPTALAHRSLTPDWRLTRRGRHPMTQVDTDGAISCVAGATLDPVAESRGSWSLPSHLPEACSFGAMAA